MLQNRRLKSKLKYHKLPLGNIETLMDDIEEEEVSEQRVDNCVEVHVKEAQMIINTFLDDIITNTYAFIQLKPDLPQWRNKDELFDLGIINRETHRQVIEKLKQRWFSMYLTQEQKWEAKIRNYKSQLEHTKGLVQQACELANEAILCRCPPRTYPILLHDRWTTFRIK
jgi:hypothetical protein